MYLFPAVCFWSPVTSLLLRFRYYMMYISSHFMWSFSVGPRYFYILYRKRSCIFSRQFVFVLMSLHYYSGIIWCIFPHTLPDPPYRRDIIFEQPLRTKSSYIIKCKKIVQESGFFSRPINFLTNTCLEIGLYMIVGTRDLV